MSDKVIESKILLEEHLSRVLESTIKIKNIDRITGGYSNLTYSLETDNGDLILRKPPSGINIKSGHDMKREFVIMNALADSKISVPETLYFESDISVLGTPFYLMKRVEGIVLRTENLKEIKPSPEAFYNLSCASISQLVDLHNLSIDNKDLSGLGRPAGYVERQVEGWIKRYQNAKTDTIPEMELMGKWMRENGLYEDKAALIHNDYKYDNLILNQKDLGCINAILDWEMATIGHPLMDLGTCLAYWVEDADEAALKIFNTTWLPGNMSRKEVVAYYGQLTNSTLPDMLFYLVFGLYKIAVIAQQIYYRYSIGKARDQRFGLLIHVVKSAAKKGVHYIDKGEI